MTCPFQLLAGYDERNSPLITEFQHLGEALRFAVEYAADPERDVDQIGIFSADVELVYKVESYNPRLSPDARDKWAVVIKKPHSS